MAQTADRIGLLGGSFDPVHNAHLALAHAALDALALQQLRWLPAGQPWQKQQAGRAVTPAVHRLAMLQLAIAGEAGQAGEAAAAGDPRFAIDTRELERSGPSYTIDTIESLAAELPGAEWLLILGFDQYAGLPSWHRWRELLARVTLAVAQRPGAPASVPPALQETTHRVVALPLPAMAVSSTTVRNAVAAGTDISRLVPPQVARYIEFNGLYVRPARS